MSLWRETKMTISKEDSDRLWKKLRLDWDYNSNRIEGNTLTYGETELLLLFGRSMGGRLARHYDEMRAHDVAINYIQKHSASSEPITEVIIRDLNRILLKEPYWRDAETAEGMPTKKQIVPGKYKSLPNHVRTQTGELHRFATPEETPARMHEWIQAFRRDIERKHYPLPILLAESHWRFLCIHPFDDGNGRTARLLTNYALLRRDLPPIVIKAQERDQYIRCLESADSGSLMPLIGFMARNIEWSLELAGRAAKGLSLTEKGDAAKEAERFVRQMEGDIDVSDQSENLDKLYLLQIRPTIELARRVLATFAPLFWKHTVYSSIETDGYRTNGNLLEEQSWNSTKKNHLLPFVSRLSNSKSIVLSEDLHFWKYKRVGIKEFQLTVRLTWTLLEVGFRFEVKTSSTDSVGAEYGLFSETISENLYSDLETINPDLESTVHKICQLVMDAIEQLSDKNGSTDNKNRTN